MSRVGVFPAAGALGSSIIKHLLPRVPPPKLILVARKPDNLAREAEAGATIRHADYDDPATLDHAFDDVDILMLISYPSFEIDYRFKAHKAAIDAAVKSGVKHIFYSSLAFAGDHGQTSVAHVMGAHLATEKYLASNLPPPVTYTVVREGLYSESFPIYTSWFDLHNPSDEIAIPHDGSGPGVAWAKRDELGEATAKLVADYAEATAGPNIAVGFPYVNRVVLLTGPREVSMRETVEVLGRVVGKTVTLRTITVDEYARLPHRGRHTYHGVDLAREWATAWAAIQLGETAVVTPTLKEVLGREPEDFETTIRGLL